MGDVSHGQLTRACHWFARVQISCDVDAKGPNLALQETSPSQPTSSGHSYKGSSHSSTSLGNPTLPLFDTTAGRLGFPVLNHSYSSSLSLSKFYYYSLTWVLIFLCFIRLQINIGSSGYYKPVVCNGISWSVGFPS